MPPVNMPQLMRELKAAGVMPQRGIVTHDGQKETLQAIDEQGLPMALPAAAQAIVDAHVALPDPVKLAETRRIDVATRTTDDVLTEAFRLDTNTRTLYRLTLSVTAIDAGNGVAMDIEARAMFKRLNAGLVQVGTRTVLSVFRDTAAATWDVQPGVSSDGTSFTVSVKGALNRTIDWMITGEVRVYTPDGLPEMVAPPLPPPPPPVAPLVNMPAIPGA